MNIYNSLNTFFGACIPFARPSFQLKQIVEYTPPRIYNDRDKTSAISEKLQPCLQALEIRRDLTIRTCVCMGALGGMAVGSNDYSKGALIVVSPNLYDIDPHAALFFAKHEVAHIKHNDPAYIHIVKIIAVAVAMILLYFVVEMPQPDGIATNNMLAMIVGVATTALHSQYFEARADDIAIKHASVAELQGACRFFRAMQEYNKQTREAAPKWEKICRSPTGEYRLDMWHPSIQSRLEKVEKALTLKNYDSFSADESKEKEQKLVESFVAEKKLTDDEIAAAGGQLKWGLRQLGL